MQEKAELWNLLPRALRMQRGYPDTVVEWTSTSETCSRLPDRHILSSKELETERALRVNIAYSCPSFTPTRSMLKTGDSVA